MSIKKFGVYLVVGMLLLHSSISVGAIADLQPSQYTTDHNTDSTTQEELMINNGIAMQSYTNSGALVFNGNTDLTSFVSNNSMQGNGTKSNPYVIENLNITSLSRFAINLNGISLHVIFSDIVIYSSLEGVKVSNSHNITLSQITYQNRNASLEENGYYMGLKIDYSSNISIFNSKFHHYGPRSYGGYIYHSTNIKMFNNSIRGKYFGMQIYESNSYLESNDISASGRSNYPWGLSLKASNNTLVDNRISCSEYVSAEIAGTNNQVINNTFESGTGPGSDQHSHGVAIRGKGHLFQQNSVYGSGGYAIGLTGSFNDSAIVDNQFIGGLLGYTVGWTIHQVYNNTFLHNYFKGHENSIAEEDFSRHIGNRYFNNTYDGPMEGIPHVKLPKNGSSIFGGDPLEVEYINSDATGRYWWNSTEKQLDEEHDKVMIPEEVGVYNFGIEVRNSDNEVFRKYVMYRVIKKPHTPPQHVSSPDNLTLTEPHEPQELVWVYEDAEPDEYEISINGEVIIIDEWESGQELTYTFEDFSNGTYIIALRIWDIYDNQISDQVKIVVKSPPPEVSLSNAPLGSPNQFLIISMSIVLIPLINRYKRSYPNLRRAE